jgi:GNAT superfamily N-acetyltransferase
MSRYHLENLGRSAYLASIASIKDANSAAFAGQALKWWDRHFSWNAHGCVVLADAQNNHLCYIFYKIDRYHEYLTIHNLFTPLQKRRKGYAKDLLRIVFDLAVSERVRRFKFVSVPKSLDFYLSLGFVYWGLTSTGDYYCDLPLPSGGLDDVNAMVKRSSIGTLAGEKLETIRTRVDGNDSGFGYGNDRRKMGERYLLNELQELKRTER